MTCPRHDLLAGTFWPELPDTTARRRLSQALWHIRRTLAPLPVLLTERNTVQSNPDLPLWLDTEEFARHKAQDTRGEAGAIEHYELCLEYYKGEFLAGYYDDWIVVERERLREMLLTTLERLVAGYKRQGDYERALLHARRLASEDPWREDAHREVMRLCHLLGHPGQALKQFDTCCQILAEDLETKPSSETVTLAREIAQLSGDSLVVDLPVMALPAGLVLPSAEAADLPLVGRETERAQLLGHVEGLMRGLGGVVLVEGEAGVGKTRLLQTLARDAEWRGAEVLWGASREVEGTAPYGPLGEALNDGLTLLRVGQLNRLVDDIWLQVLAPLLPPLAAQLPDLPSPPPLDPAQEQTRLVVALGQFLSGWAQVVPLLLVLEDLHWANKDTLDLLARLAPGTGARGVLIVGSYRSEKARALPAVWDRLQALDRAGVQRRLELGGLDAQATGELVRRCLGMSSAAPFFELRLYQETRGNPLFILETLRSLYDENLLARDASGQWSTPWEWYVNDESGLEQGFGLAAPPGETATGEPLQLALHIGGDLAGEVVRDGAAVEFHNPGGEDGLRYGSLRAQDAEGRSLPAWLSLQGATLSLLVDDTEAAYPLQIISTITGLPDDYDWSIIADQLGADDLLGYSVATAGDVNGDGYSDILVGAPGSIYGTDLRGYVNVYHGGPSTLSDTAGWSRDSNLEDAQFGWSLGTAGDVNGDGYADIVVGTPYWDGGQTDAGKVWVYHGGETGPSATSNWSKEPDQAEAQFGHAVGSAGDVNGDGYADVLVGVPGYDNPTDSEGMAFLYYGNGSRGVSLRPYLFDSLGPMAHLGQAHDTVTFCLQGNNPFGQTDVSIELDVKRLGQNFDGTDTWRYPGYVPVANLCITDPMHSDSLVKPDGSQYHWRARWHYDPVTMPWMPASRWLTIPWNGWNEADLRSPEAEESEFQIFLTLVVRNYD